MALAMGLEIPRNVEFEGLEADVTNTDRVTPPRGWRGRRPCPSYDEMCTAVPCRGPMVRVMRLSRPCA